MQLANFFGGTALAATLFFVSSGMAQDIRPPASEVPPPTASYSPFADEHYPLDVYFGDTHLHTSWSTDAGMAGATLGPDAAYRIAQGGEVTSFNGFRVKLKRPLDFLVVADHAENLGLADFIRRDDPAVLASPTGKKWHDMVKTGEGYDAFIEWLRGTSENKDQIDNPDMTRAAWDSVIANAEANNRPGAFTALIGFEWTSQPGGNNIHRVVIFRDGKARVSQVVPFSTYDSDDPEKLWDYMQAYEDATKGKVLAIPHNGNLSNGIMFDTETLSGQSIDADYARRRMALEPLYEVTQSKGDAEAHPFLSPDDAFADFETMDKGNITGSQAKTNDMLAGEYARSALKRGLAMQGKLGVNPYKFGMVGSTDNHTALPTTREDNWFGKAHIVEPSAERYKDVLIEGEKPELSITATDLGASGLAAVWARENTREAIWDAMARREVYATSGSRLRVRVFAGWDFKPDEVYLPDFAKQGYGRGVPMGGDLTAAPEGASPKFLIRALRDPEGANLDRIQVIKGWIDADGRAQERVIDVACSDGRNINGDAKCEKPVGNTVDVANASYTNSIGDALLGTFWEDTDFDPTRRAFYYVRVIEIPKPRWTAYDQKFFGVTMPQGTRMAVQDRAYTSPIWYNP
jgi:hypothetical protein